MVCEGVFQTGKARRKPPLTVFAFSYRVLCTETFLRGRQCVYQDKNIKVDIVLA